PLALAPVPRFSAVAFAPGTTAPDWSVTTPLMAPSVVDCAKAPEASNTMTVRARQKHTTDFSIRLILMEVFSLSFIDDTPRTRAHLKRSGGGVEGSRHSGDRSYCPQKPILDSNQHPDLWPNFYHRNNM